MLFFGKDGSCLGFRDCVGHDHHPDVDDYQLDKIDEWKKVT